MISKATDEQWEWINQLAALPIFDLAAVSLGYQVEVFPPVFSDGWTDKPNPKAPEGFRDRIILTFDHVRAGTLKATGRSSALGHSYSPDDQIKDGEWWEVLVLDFRHFCDRMRWEVPKEFLPIGYRADTPEPIAMGAAVGAQLAVHRVQVTKRRRNDLLSPLIEKAQDRANSRFDPSEIWNLLSEMAEKREKPLIGITEEGLQWVNANDEQKYLSIKGLGDRLRRVKNAAH